MGSDVYPAITLFPGILQAEDAFISRIISFAVSFLEERTGNWPGVRRVGDCEYFGVSQLYGVSEGPLQ